MYENAIFNRIINVINEMGYEHVDDIVQDLEISDDELDIFLNILHKEKDAAIKKLTT